jgi:hypothetical protein
VKAGEPGPPARGARSPPLRPVREAPGERRTASRRRPAPALRPRVRGPRTRGDAAATRPVGRLLCCPHPSPSRRSSEWRAASAAIAASAEPSGGTSASAVTPGTALFDHNTVDNRERPGHVWEAGPRERIHHGDLVRCELPVRMGPEDGHAWLSPGHADRPPLDPRAYALHLHLTVGRDAQRAKHGRPVSEHGGSGAPGPSAGTSGSSGCPVPNH